MTKDTTAGGMEAVRSHEVLAMIRDAFMAGRGLGDGDKISDADRAAWADYDPSRLAAYRRWTAALAASPAPAPAGWKLVPIEPSRAMVDAAYAAHDAYDDKPEPKAWCGLADAYRAMLAAAPSLNAGETGNG